ncbi:unnamed protein product [Camellia sinensis]
MGNYHFVYNDVEGASTQWDDIQRKLGNLPPKPPAFKPPSFKPAEDEDSKHKDKARHRDCDYHRRLRLYLAGNSFTGGIPYSISQMTSLKYLTFVMPSRMCINPIHNNKGLFHQSDNANSEERWAASSCAMDSLYDLELISNTVPVVFDNSETWHLALSTSLKLGSRGMAHVQKITCVDLKEKSQYSNILLINRTASPLAWVYGVQRSKKPHCYNVAIFISSFNGCPETMTCSRKGGMDLIAVIRASGRISHARGLNVPSSGIVGEQFIEKIRRVRVGWRLPDMMFATKCSLSDACNTIAKQLENVYSSIALETTKFLYGCAVNSYILNVNWLIDSVAAGYALPRDKSLKAWILAHKPPVAPKYDLPLKVSDKINLGIQRVVGYRQWCNKLWNAVRFAMSKLGDNYTPPTNVVPDIMPFNCQWILSVLNKAISKTVTSLDSYEFSDAATVVYSWWQFQLCDVFIEAVKPYFASDAQAFASERSYAQDTLSCWTNEKVEYEMDMIESAVKSLRSLRALMPAKERHERSVFTSFLEKALSGWRDELRKDIEQLCMQQAGPGYLVVATRMHFQRIAGTVPYITTALMDAKRGTEGRKDFLIGYQGNLVD